MLITLVSEPSFKRRFMASFWLGTTAWRWSRSSPAGPYLADSGSPVPLRLRHKDTEAHAAPPPTSYVQPDTAFAFLIPST